jgi:hypothetical protein
MRKSPFGELTIDHRASPGLPGMPKLFETATCMCAHCNTLVVLNPLRTRERGHCRKCSAYICDNPACHAECTPFTKILDDAERDALRAIARGMF